jgi:hypothetical protein
MNGVWTCSKLGLCVYRYMLLFHFRRFSIVYSLVEGGSVLSGNGIIHNLQLRGILNAVDSLQLHHPIHAYFIACSGRAEEFSCALKM